MLKPLMTLAARSHNEHCLVPRGPAQVNRPGESRASGNSGGVKVLSRSAPAATQTASVAGPGSHETGKTMLPPAG